MAYGEIDVTSTGTRHVAVDVVSSREFQRVKLTHGAEGTANEATTSTPVPVRDATPAVAPSQGEVSVGTPATKIADPPATGRRGVTIQNVGTQNVALGGASVTMTGSTGGLLLTPGGTCTLPINDATDLYGIVAGGTCAVRFFQHA